MNRQPPRLTVGILGGMGPAATLDLMQRMLRLSLGETDQDSVRMLVDNNPLVPDRNKALAGHGPSPAPALAAMARGLERSGADFLVIACNTAHAYAADIAGAVKIPLVHMISEALAVLPEKPGLVGLLAAAGCLDAGLYQQALAARNIAMITPEGGEREQLMRLLYAIKKGDTGEAVKKDMMAISAGLVARGAGIIIAGCTEVPLVLAQKNVAVPLIDSTEILARAATDIAYGRRPLPNTGI